MKWQVRRTKYATYVEIAAEGDIEQVVKAQGLTFEKAMALVQSLGFGYSTHQEGI